MAIPARPTPDFVVLQAHSPRGRRHATRDGPAAARHPYDRFQRRGLGGKDHRRRQLRGGADTAPDQQPAAPGGVDGSGQGQPAPVRPAGAFRSSSSPEPAPALHRQASQDRVDLPRRPAAPDLFRARDREPIGLRSGLQPPPPAPVIALHAVPGDPWGGDAGGDGAGQPVAGPLRRGRNAPVRGHPGLAATLPVLGPRRGPRPFPVQPDLAQPTGRAQTPAELAGLDGAGRAPGLAGDACRVRPFCQTAGLIEDQPAVRVSPLRHDRAAPRITHRLGVPGGPVQQRLEAGRGGRATDFCQLPAVFPLGRPAPALPIRRSPLTELRAGEGAGPSPREICHVRTAARDAPGGRRGRRRPRSWRRVITWSHGSVFPPWVRNQETRVGLLLPL
jgi:hypothetical protein